MDEKTYHVYSDKFTLNVLDLKQIAMATDEDKLWKLDYWARLFKSSTWEDIKMIASNNEYLTEASNTLYDMNSDYNIRERCRNREEYLLHEQWIQEELAKKDSMIAEQASALAEKDSALAEKDSALAEKDSALAEKDSALAEQASQITQLLKEIEALKTARK